MGKVVFLEGGKRRKKCPYFVRVKKILGQEIERFSVSVTSLWEAPVGIFFCSEFRLRDGFGFDLGVIDGFLGGRKINRILRMKSTIFAFTFE